MSLAKLSPLTLTHPTCNDGHRTPLATQTENRELQAEIDQLRDQLRATRRDTDATMAADGPQPVVDSPARTTSAPGLVREARHEADRLRFARLTGLAHDSLAAQMYLQDANYDVEEAVRAAVQGTRGYSTVRATRHRILHRRANQSFSTPPNTPPILLLAACC